MQRIVDAAGFVPKSCTWELTRRCNLRCGHCGSRAGDARGREMSRERALEVVAELRMMGCERLTLSGGEPTLCAHWEDVAGRAARLGIRTNMITNGLGPARELVRRAKGAGLDSIGTSLEGVGESHDWNRRRPGLFRQVMALLEASQAEGLPIAVITTLTKRSVAGLGRLHDLLVGQVYAWQLQLGAAMGNLHDHRAEQLDPEDLLTLLPIVAELVRERSVNIYIGDVSIR
jgi:MoaA/NifB/PqqE/SkfB family radical SAM enzyme